MQGTGDLAGNDVRPVYNVSLPFAISGFGALKP